MNAFGFPDSDQPMKRTYTAEAAPRIGPATAAHSSKEGVMDNCATLNVGTFGRNNQDTATATKEAVTAARTFVRDIVPSNTSIANRAPPKGTLYAAAIPAPAPQATRRCL